MSPAAKEWMMYAFGALIVLAFFAAICLLTFVPMPQESKDALLILLGALAAQFKDVGGYFFGSSKSSADKNALLAEKQSEPSTT
jgi:CDP-diglyceride synthetase